MEPGPQVPNRRREHAAPEDALFPMAIRIFGCQKIEEPHDLLDRIPGCQTPTVWRGVARHPPFGEGNSNCRQSLGVWVSLRQESSRKEEVTRTQKPFVATLRVNQSRPAELGQQPEASLAWGGVTLTAKRSGSMARKWLQPNCRDSVTTISRSGNTSASWIIRRRFFSANPCPNSKANWVARLGTTCSPYSARRDLRISI